MSDRRITPANGRVAHVSLRGTVAAERFVEGEDACVTAALTDLCAAPHGARDRQLLKGDGVRVLDRGDGWAFVRAAKDGYCGYVRLEALGPFREATHWVSAPATHLYPAADMKQRELAALTLGCLLTIEEETGRFARTADGAFVPLMHIRAVTDRPNDPAAVAETFLGTPYLWGGNSRAGLDCSGLVQAALLACGIPCPGDADLQEEALGSPLATGERWRRGDLFFWRGHVAMATGPDRLIHATAHRMVVCHEEIREALARIERQGDGALRVVKRL